MNANETAAIGIVTVSDRASAGTYNDVSGPAIEEFLREVVTTPWRAVRRLIPDGIDSVRDALIELADREKCALDLHHRRHRAGAARSHAGRHASPPARG